MESTNASSLILKWTQPRSNIVITNSLRGGDIEIGMFASRTCIFNGNVSRDHEVVEIAKQQLSRWAEELRVALGAASFQCLMHPEYAPTITFYAPFEKQNNNPNSCLTINVIFRKMLARVTLSLNDQPTKEFNATRF